MSGIAEQRMVLVTGGSGFVGGWMIAELLQRGFRVRTTLRNLNRAEEVRAAVNEQVSSGNRLSFVAADLRRDEGWRQAVEGCHFVAHVATPMGQGDIKGKDLLAPAREGTMRVLRAARQAGVERVVITSSTAAAQRSRISSATEEPISDETVWTDVNAKGVNDYTRAKTLAEGAAWEFMKEQAGGMTLATVLPGMVLGPVLSKGASGSVEVVSRMLTGKLPLIPRIGFSMVDVRDLVALHAEAMLTPAAAGQRFVAANDFLWMADMARILREQLGARAAKVPTRLLPDVVLRVAALFNAEARFMAPMLRQRREFAATKARTLLGWFPRPGRESVVDCGESFLRLGLA